MSDYQHFDVAQRGDVTVLRFIEQRLTSNKVVFEVDEELDKIVQEHRPPKLLVSFAPVQRSSTAIINSLLRVLRKLDRSGCQLKLCEMNDNIRGEFEMLQLDGNVFQIHVTEAEAIEAFGDALGDKYRHFKIQKRDDVFVMHLLDPRIYDNLTIYELDDELQDFWDSYAPRKLLVNFGPVSRCSTAVINSLLRVRNHLLDAGGQIKLCGLNEHIRGDFNMLALEGTVFDIYDSAAEALAQFR